MILLSDLGTGGTARATLLVANGLAEIGCEVTLLVTQAGGVQTAELDPRVKLIELHARRGRGAAMLLSARAIARWIRSERPAQIVSAGNHMHVAATLAHRLAGSPGQARPKLTNPVERPNGGWWENAMRSSWYRWAFSRAGTILTITAAAARELERAFPAAASKLHVVDNPYITPAMLALGDSAHDYEPGRLLAIGRLVDQKDYPLHAARARAGRGSALDARRARRWPSARIAAPARR